MKKKWSTEKKWESSRKEILFEKWLKENGFAITGYREYMESVDYRIEKDGIVGEYKVANTNAQSADPTIKAFETYWKILVENDAVKKEMEARKVE